MTDTPIAMLIKDTRIKLRMTQEELATALGSDVMTISRWERGENAPRIFRVLELALRQLVLEREALA